MNSTNKKRQVDFQVIARWVEEGDRVLDLGCGRGLLLEYLMQKKSIYGVGVDIDFERVLGCIKRGVSAYHGDVGKFLATFPDNAFDRVILSRSVDLLDAPDRILEESLRVGRTVTVGFVNYGFWKNRISYLIQGRRVRNEVFSNQWHTSIRANPFSIMEFEDFCRSSDIQVRDRVYLSGDWRNECRVAPNWMSGYAIYDLAKRD
jgi:methionine biosynthesis protein MetW